MAVRLPTWRNGRRAAFRSQSFHEGEGSSPFVGTTFFCFENGFFSHSFFPFSLGRFLSSTASDKRSCFPVIRSRTWSGLSSMTLMSGNARMRLDLAEVGADHAKSIYAIFVATSCNLHTFLFSFETRMVSLENCGLPAYREVRPTVLAFRSFAMMQGNSRCRFFHHLVSLYLCSPNSLVRNSRKNKKRILTPYQ